MNNLLALDIVQQTGRGHTMYYLIAKNVNVFDSQTAVYAHIIQM